MMTNLRPRSTRTAYAFSLVELLTVIFIISLLIAILVPSLSASRNAAKKLTTAKTVDAIKAGLEMFKNDNGADFAQSNGYPPSFSHPPIPDAAPTFGAKEAADGKFPFLDKSPVVFGAQWLPAMLTGVDQLGYIKRSAVPGANDLRKHPDKWYTPDAVPGSPPQGITDRSPKYIDAENLRMMKTKNLPGRPNQALFPNWGDVDTVSNRDTQNLPVIVDAFDQPILYYVSTSHGQPTNMVETKHKSDNSYSGGPQANGRPYYFHQDNEAFTGDDTTPGWDFAGNAKPHAIAESGATQTPAEWFTDDPPTATFAHYIIDRKLLSTFNNGTFATTPMKPVNAETYLLISAGVDGRFGTTDDVSNLPPFPNE